MSEAENQDAAATSAEETEGTDNRIYEIGYLLAPSVAPENVPAVYGNLKELVASTGGAIISDEMPKEVRLAYTISKVLQNARKNFDDAYFGWFKFEAEPEKISAIEKKFKDEPDVIRFLTVKTLRENTIASKRFVQRDIRKKISVPGKEDEAAAPIDKEEIDKEIEAMVAN